VKKSDKELKIAFVSQPWDHVVVPVDNGSIPIWTYEVARRLSSQCRCLIYAKRKHGQPRIQTYDAVTCIRVPILRDLLAHKFIRRIPGLDKPRMPFFSRKAYHYFYIRSVARSLRLQRCDIVHIFNFSQFVPVIRAVNPKVKIVLNMRCEWLAQLDPVVIDSRLDQTDMIIGCSEYITDQIRRTFPRHAAKCRTVLNGVDIERFRRCGEPTSRNGYKSLLFVGRISPEKGLHVLIDAFAIVGACYPSARLVIIGPDGPAPREFIVGISSEEKVRALEPFCKGNYQSQLKARLSPSIASRVQFTGPISNERLVEFYRDADVLINPSFSESFGRSLIEAMACGVPVVASRVGGMPEIVEDRRTGLLVESGDVEGLARAIEELLGDASRRRAMGAAGSRRVAERYSWARIADDLLVCYREL